jgi:hypothetical protein
MRRFWPACEAAQVDYETLREVVLAGGAALSVAARRFDQRGLAGLIAWPAAEPVFCGRIVGAARPPWTPHADPRIESLASGFELLVATTADYEAVAKEAQ